MSLPSIPLQTLLTVATEKYVTETAKQLEQVNKTHDKRDLEGIYVYHNYMQRLRRLHQSYVKKCKYVQPQRQQQQEQQHHHHYQQQQQQQQKQHCSQLEPLRNSHKKLTTISGAQFRLSLSRIPQNSSQPSDQVPGPRGSETVSSTAPQDLEAKDDKDDFKDYKYDGGAKLGSSRRPIYIPCGREPNPLYLRQQQEQRQQLTEKTPRKIDQSGTLSFRMWRNLYQQHRTIYSS